MSLININWVTLITPLTNSLSPLHQLKFPLFIYCLKLIKLAYDLLCDVILQTINSLRSGAILGESECLINFKRSRKKREEKNAKKQERRKKGEGREINSPSPFFRLSYIFAVFFLAFLSRPSKINKTLTLPQNSAATQARQLIHAR